MARALPCARALAACAAASSLPWGRRRSTASCDGAAAAPGLGRSPAARPVRIEAETLLPGRGPPVKDAVVVLENGKISYAGARAGAPQVGNAEVFVGNTVMPGMWDCHVHFIGCSDKPGKELMQEVIQSPEGVRALRCVGHAAKMLDAGFTSAREVGGLGHLVAAAAADGSIRAPRVYYAGQILSTTGGHADVHDLPLEWVQTCPHHIGCLCDGVPECLRAVRRQLRIGASLIKVCTSGGVMSKVDDPLHQQFSDEELAAIVAEASRSKVAVAAHCHGPAGILAALRAGCLTIEHGSYLNEELADLMLEKGAILVPTRWIVETLKGVIGERKVGDAPPQGLAQWQSDKLIEVYEQHREALKLAIRRRIPIAVGCDLFIAKEFGYHGRELAYLVECGMSPLEAVEAATANGPLTLGPRAPTSGQLREGFDGDVLIVERCPLDDIGVLGNPKLVTHVFQAGRLVKPQPVTPGPAGHAYATWDQA